MNNSLKKQDEAPGKNTGVGCNALPQGIFLTQETNRGLLLAGRFFTSWSTREAPRRWRQISWIVPGTGRGSPDCLSTEGQGIHLRSRILKFRVLDLGSRVWWLRQGFNPRKKQVCPRTEWLARQLEATVSASRETLLLPSWETLRKLLFWARILSVKWDQCYLPWGLEWLNHRLHKRVSERDSYIVSTEGPRLPCSMLRPLVGMRMHNTVVSVLGEVFLRPIRQRILES